MGWTREDWLKYRKADQEVALSYKECRLCGSYLDRCLEGLLYYNWSDTCNPAPHALKYREEQYEHAGLSWDKYRRTLSDELQKTLGEICGRCLNMFTGRSGSYVNLTICYCTLWNFNKFVADILVESAARKKKGFIPFSHCAAGCYHPNIARYIVDGYPVCFLHEKQFRMNPLKFYSIINEPPVPKRITEDNPDESLDRILDYLTELRKQV